MRLLSLPRRKVVDSYAKDLSIDSEESESDTSSVSGAAKQSTAKHENGEFSLE